jgi:hypothetical protein
MSVQRDRSLLFPTFCAVLRTSLIPLPISTELVTSLQPAISSRLAISNQLPIASVCIRIDFMSPTRIE